MLDRRKNKEMMDYDMLTMLAAGISLYALYISTDAKSIVDEQKDRLDECVTILKYCIKVIKKNEAMKEEEDE